MLELQETAPLPIASHEVQQGIPHAGIACAGAAWCEVHLEKRHPRCSEGAGASACAASVASVLPLSAWPTGCGSRRTGPIARALLDLMPFSAVYTSPPPNKDAHMSGARCGLRQAGWRQSERGAVPTTRFGELASALARVILDRMHLVLTVGTSRAQNYRRCQFFAAEDKLDFSDTTQSRQCCLPMCGWRCAASNTRAFQLHGNGFPI